MLPLRSWLRSLLSVEQPARPFRRSSKQRRSRVPSVPLRFEHLEVRSLLATFLVDTTADSGPGSLCEAIEAANANAADDTITFDTANVFATPNRIQVSVLYGFFLLLPAQFTAKVAVTY